MITGYEQVRSIAAEIAGYRDAAERVELVLPDTGVCNRSAGPVTNNCSGGSGLAGVDACCASDANFKENRKSGVGAR
jgi:hypothetical protein